MRGPRRRVLLPTRALWCRDEYQHLDPDQRQLARDIERITQTEELEEK